MSNSGYIIRTEEEQQELGREKMVHHQRAKGQSMPAQHIWRYHPRTYWRRKYTKTTKKHKSINYEVQWNLVIKRSDITKPSYNKVILLVPALYISLFVYPDITRNLTYNKVIFMVPRTSL